MVTTILTFINRARRRLYAIVSKTIVKVRVRLASRHVSGPKRIILSATDVAMVCMIKNGAYYVDALLNHHRAIGVQNFLFIDNGSDDGTLELLSKEPGVTVVSNHLPVARYESVLRAQIARRFIQGGWFLFVDSDELMEMVHGEHRSIQDYTGYCNDHGYDIVVGQMLELFSPHPLSVTAPWTYAECITAFDRFSLHEIEEFDYHDPINNSHSWFLCSNTVSNDDIKIKYGGIRREVFGEYCGLTAHKLVKNIPDIGLYAHPHSSTNAHCADFTMLIRHYKFAGSFLAREREQVAKGVWQHGEDRQRLKVIGDSEFVITGQQEQRYAGTAALVDEGFLACSERFLSHFPRDQLK